VLYQKPDRKKEILLMSPLNSNPIQQQFSLLHHDITIVDSYSEAKKYLQSSSLQQLTLMPPPIVESMSYCLRTPKLMAVPNFLANALIFASGERHTSNRGEVNPSWKQFLKTPSLHELLTDHVDLSLKILQEKVAQKNGSLDIVTDFLQDFMVSLISRVLFGNDITPQEMHELKNAALEMTNLITKLNIETTLLLVNCLAKPISQGIPNLLKMLIGAGPIAKIGFIPIFKALIAFAKMNAMTTTILSRNSQGGFLKAHTSKLNQTNKEYAKLLAFVNFSYIATSGNSVTCLAHTLRLLLENPKEMRILKQCPELARGAILEGLRVSPPLKYIFRMKPSPSHQLHISPGYLINIESANRSEAQYGPTEHCFDILRFSQDNPQPEPLSFSVGRHHCMGQTLIMEASEQLLQKMLATFEITPQAQAPWLKPPNNTFSNAINSLPLNFCPTVNSFVKKP